VRSHWPARRERNGDRPPECSVSLAAEALPRRGLAIDLSIGPAAETEAP
jgi:hypothetical protein